MGATKGYIEENEQLYNFDTTEFLCSHHIEEKYIIKFILINGKIRRCSYCKSKRKSLELSEVLKLIVDGINFNYEDPNNTRYYNKDNVYGFDGNIMPFNEMYFDLGLEINNSELQNDITKYLYNNSLYCRKDEYISESDYYHSAWNNLKEIVKTKARFVFHFEQQFSTYGSANPIDILNKVQNSISHFNLFRSIDASKKLYRCRQHEKENEIDELGINIASNPTLNCKTNNRMSPAGISMFYSSPHKDICINEVVNFKNKKKPYYTTAFFRPKKTLKLVDLTQIPEIPSAFDKKNNMQIETLFFLKDFIKDISKPIHENDSIIEYVPTQIVTEYIRYNPSLKVDGLIYSSSIDNLKENYVLFMNHEESLKELYFDSKSIKINKINFKK
jgi:hypothetical protein